MLLIPLNSQAWLILEEWVVSEWYLTYPNVENPIFQENGAYQQEALLVFLVVEGYTIFLS